MRKSPDEESGIDWKVLLEDVSFSGIERDLKKDKEVKFRVGNVP